MTLPAEQNLVNVQAAFFKSDSASGEVNFPGTECFHIDKIAACRLVGAQALEPVAAGESVMRTHPFDIEHGEAFLFGGGDHVG